MPSKPHLSTTELSEAGQTCACFNLRRAARAVTQMYDEILRPAGIRSSQLMLLAAIGVEAPASVKTLADVMGMDRTTLSRNLAPLERDGLVRSSPGKDRRVREIELTEKGDEMLAVALPLWREAQERLGQILGDERLQSLLQEVATAAEAIRS